MIGFNMILLGFLGVYLAVFLKTLFFHTYLWQKREYLVARVLNELKTQTGKKHYLNYSNTSKLFLIFLSILLPQYPNLLNATIILIFINDFLAGIISFKNKKLKVPPKFTLKILSIILLSLISSLLFFFSLNYFKLRILPKLLIIERLLPLQVFLLVLLSKIPTKILKVIIIFKAKQKMKKFPHLKIIGITGSFGKTSVKEFAAQILSAKYKVLKTEKNINTDIGVAETILKKLNKDHQVFVVEMGAYKREEIKDICQITPPDISILTAISEQHQESFKSLKNTILTKSEIFKYQKIGGTRIINADNQYSLQIAQKLKQKKTLYSITKKTNLYAQDISVLPEGLRFTLVKNKKKTIIESKLLGRHNVSNLLAAIAAALKLGLNLEEIKEKVKKITSLEKSLKLIPGIKDTILIDDSHNANPDGILAALEYLKIYPKRKKIIVASGMYELGASAKRLHFEMGKAIGKICNLAIFTNIDYQNELTKGFLKFGLKESLIFEDDLKKAKEILAENLDKNTLVLFEGRTTELILKAFKKG